MFVVWKIVRRTMLVAVLCLTPFAEAQEFLPLEEAETFRVELLDQGMRRVMLHPESDEEVVYLLVPRGVESPPAKPNEQVVVIPPKTFVTTSTAELPHVLRLELLDRLVGHDEFDYVYSPKVRARAAAGAMIEIGADGRLNPELLIQAQPDLVLASGTGDLEGMSQQKIDELGIQIVRVPSFLERSALGQAEWIKFTAVFFGREAQAEALFQPIVQRYRELRDLARDASHRPTVFTSAPLGDVWYVPGGQTLMARLLKDAGAEYLWADEPSKTVLTRALESVWAEALTAEIWLHPGAWRSRTEIKQLDPRLARLGAFRSGEIYNNDARTNGLGDPAQGTYGGNDYWESGNSRPDLVLADLIKIFHPELLPDHELFYHRRIDP